MPLVAGRASCSRLCRPVRGWLRSASCSGRWACCSDIRSPSSRPRCRLYVRALRLWLGGRSPGYLGQGAIAPAFARAVPSALALGLSRASRVFPSSARYRRRPALLASLSWATIAPGRLPFLVVQQIEARVVLDWSRAVQSLLPARCRPVCRGGDQLAPSSGRWACCSAIHSPSSSTPRYGASRCARPWARMSRSSASRKRPTERAGYFQV